MSQGGGLRIRDVGAYLGISHQRADQMFHEGKLPEPERVGGIGPQWKPATIERWAEREWWGSPAVAHIETERRL
jgi:predicted DNA-binding transcriptional regulator AlpA